MNYREYSIKMKKNYKKKFLNKLIILVYLLLAPITSSAEIGNKKWTKECDKKNKKVCVIIINSQVPVPNSDKKQTLATAYIQLVKTGDKIIPFIKVNLPLNVSLKKNPLFLIDKKSVFNLPFSHCNNTDGCVVNGGLNQDHIKLLKAGNELTITSAIYRSKKNININLPLKGFSKAYKGLLK